MSDPEPQDPKPSKPEDNPAHAWAKYSHIALILPSSVVAGILLGALADRWFHKDWLLLPGVILGAIAGFIQLTRTLVKASKE